MIKISDLVVRLTSLRNGLEDTLQLHENPIVEDTIIEIDELLEELED